MPLQENPILKCPIFPCSFYSKLFVFNQPSWWPSKKLFSVAKPTSNVTFLLCSALYPDTLLLICQPQPFVPPAIIKNCARDLSISKSWNHEPLYVLKRTVTLLNGFQPLGLQIKEGVLQLANQGGSRYIGLQITTYLHFKQRHFWEKWIWKLHQHAVRKCCANTCCANICCAIYALQIHGV